MQPGKAKSPLRRLFGYTPASSEIPDLREAGGYKLSHAVHVLHTHRHDSTRLEICCILKGRQTQVINGRPFLLMPGEAVVVYPNDEHGAMSSPQEPALVYYLIVAVRPEPDAFLNLRDADARQLRQAVLNLPHRHFRLSPLARILLENVPGLLEEWTRSSGATRSSAALRVRTNIAALLTEMAACAAKPAPPRDTPWSRRVLSYIENHIAGSLTPGRLAGHMGLSLPHFKARFKKEIGLPPADYVLRRKIEIAGRLLTRPDATVTRVAYDLGFSSSSYFSTAFKRYTGKAPALYQAWKR
jgi:AraC-like DNA-binding protein